MGMFEEGGPGLEYGIFSSEGALEFRIKGHEKDVLTKNMLG
jgi:hypothetical protein